MDKHGARTSIHVDRESIGFAAAHFGIIGAGRETLHGHNYRVAVRADGGLGPQGTVVDFASLKGALRAECAALDHRMLVPAACPEVEVREDVEPGHIALRVGGDRFLFPAGDVALLPVRNTTCECLAAHLLSRLRGRLGGLEVHLEVRVDEADGQGATVAEA